MACLIAIGFLLKIREGHYQTIGILTMGIYHSIPITFIWSNPVLFLTLKLNASRLVRYH